MERISKIDYYLGINGRSTIFSGHGLAEALTALDKGEYA